MAHLEQTLRSAIIQGQPLTHKAWEKILIVVEGVYRYVTVLGQIMFPLHEKNHLAFEIENGKSK
jgi:hypothetical protein